MAVRGLGLDEGTATLKVVEVERHGATVIPVRAVSLAAPDGGGLPAAELKAALARAGIKSRPVVAGLTGKDLVIRYHQVPSVPDWQLRKIMDFEIDELRQQSGDAMAADFNLLPVASDLTSDDLVLLALTREERLDERSAGLKAAGLKARYFTPNAIALYHAFREYGPAVEGDVVVASIGKTCSDIAILRDGDLLYARSVNTAGDVLTDALVEKFNVSAAKAEKLKQDFGDLRPRESRKNLTPQQEKVSYALEGAAGRLFSMLQSTLQFAKSQLQLNQLQPARVFVTGGSARLAGLDDYLASSLGCPVEVFDPLAQHELEVEGPAGTPDLTVALGLALMAADPGAYAVEVLAAPMRRAREFQEKHAFTLLAVVLVAGFLVFNFVRAKAEYAAAGADNSRIQAEERQRKSNKSRLDQLLEERAVLADRVDQLEKRRAGGRGIAEGLRLLVENLPEDLWVRELALDQESGDRRSKEARSPVVLLEGAGKSRGERSVDAAYGQFVQAMRAAPSLAGPEQFVDYPPTQRDKFEFKLKLDLLRRPAAGGAGGAEDEEDEEEPADAADPGAGAATGGGGEE